MRRAEKAGREAASAWIAASRHTTRDQIEREIDRGSWSSAGECHEWFDRLIGARNLSGRAYQSALEAYDRGYRARLAEALSDLEKPICPSCDRSTSHLIRMVGRTVCPECSGFLITTLKTRDLEGDED